jgi:hypothetical protein
LLTKLDNTDYSSAKVQSSKFLIFLAILTYGLAFGALSIACATKPFLIVLFPLIAWHGIRVLHKECLRTSPDAIVYYHQISKDRWHLTNRAGKTLVCRHCDYPFRSKIFIQMAFQTIPFERRIKLLVAFDAIPHEAYRYLVSSLWDQD